VTINEEILYEAAKSAVAELNQNLKVKTYKNQIVIWIQQFK